MALRTINANWLAAFENDSVADILLATFTFADGGGTAKFISGSVPTYDAYMGLDGASPIGRQMDDYSRAVSLDELVLTFIDDEVTRGIFTSKSMRGSELKLEYGDRNLVEGDLATVFEEGIVIDCVSIPGGWEVTVNDSGELISNHDVNPFFYSLPLPEMAKAILNRASVVDGDITLSEFLSLNHPTIAHLMVTTREFGEFTGPASQSSIDPDLAPLAGELGASLHSRTISVRSTSPRLSTPSGVPTRNAQAYIDDIAFMAGAQIYYDPTVAKWRFEITDNSAAVDVHFTREEISDFEQVDNYRSIINKFQVFGASSNDAGRLQYLVRKETTAQAAFKTSGLYVSGRTEEPSISQSHKTIGPLTAPTTPGGTSMRVSLAYIGGFSGIWQTDAAGARTFPNAVGNAQQAVHQISASKPAWLLITDSDPKLGRRDLVKATAMSFATAGYRDFGDGLTYVAATYTVVRADGSPEFHYTDEQDWQDKLGSPSSDPFIVYDITKEKLLADRIISRFAYGVPIVAITVPSSYGERMFLGQLISANMPEFVGHKINGSNSTVKWEVVGLTPHRSGDTAGVRLLLSFVSSPGSPVAIPESDIDDEEGDVVTASDSGILGLVGANIHQVYGSLGEVVIGTV